MPVSEDRAAIYADGAERFWFCSEFCRQEFLRHPRAYLAEPVRPPTLVHWASRRVAYFSMEVALSNDMPTYSGGLGVLAGDTLRSCADLDVPVVGISLVHRRGYFRQAIQDDWQIERDAPWDPGRGLKELEPRVTVSIEGRTVQLRAWRYDIIGTGGYTVRVRQYMMHASSLDGAP
jgi:starch phosphorylase